MNKQFTEANRLSNNKTNQILQKFFLLKKIDFITTKTTVAKKGVEMTSKDKRKPAIQHEPRKSKKNSLIK